MFGKGIQIGNVNGIKIEIDLSWILIFILSLFSLGAGYFPTVYPEWGAGEIWLAAIVTTVLFFASVLIHELSHSLVAQMRGMEVKNIRLFIFGGVSNIQREATTPGEEFIIAFVGPFSSIVLASIFYLISVITNQSSPAHLVSSYLAVMNLALGIFNLIPGFPLDGGRVFRAIVWAVTRNYTIATRTASIAGLFIGYALIFIGVWLALAGGLFDGLWVGLIGWFISKGATETYQQVVLKNMLQGVHVGDVMSQPQHTVSPNMSLTQLVQEYFIYRAQQILPVVENDYLVGLVAAEQLRHVPPAEWDNVPVRQVMLRRQTLQVAHPWDDLQSVLDTLGKQHQSQYLIPILNETGQLVGILSPIEMMRFLQLRQQYGFGNPATKGKSSYVPVMPASNKFYNPKPRTNNEQDKAGKAGGGGSTPMPQ